MGKLFDAREVEFAFVSDVYIQPKDDKLFMSIGYQLLDVNRELISTKAVEHTVDSVPNPTVAQIKQAFTNNFQILVRADKEALSGYIDQTVV